MRKKGGSLGSRVNGVVVGELKKMKVLLPIVFSAVDKSSKTFNDGSIRSFYLAVSLRIVGRRVDDLCSKCRKDVFPKAGRELRALVGKKPMRKPVMAKRVLDKETRGLLGGKLLRACCKPKHFGELVHEDQNASIRV